MCLWPNIYTRLGWIFAEVTVEVQATDVNKSLILYNHKILQSTNRSLAYVTSSLSLDQLISVLHLHLLGGVQTWHLESIRHRSRWLKEENRLSQKSRHQHDPDHLLWDGHPQVRSFQNGIRLCLLCKSNQTQVAMEGAWMTQQLRRVFRLVRQCKGMVRFG